jgi:hypothetical protein
MAGSGETGDDSVRVRDGGRIGAGDRGGQIAVAVGAWDGGDPRAREEDDGAAVERREDVLGVAKHKWVNGRIRTDNLRLMRPPL